MGPVACSFPGRTFEDLPEGSDAALEADVAALEDAELKDASAEPEAALPEAGGPEADADSGVQEAQAPDADSAAPEDADSSVPQDADSSVALDADSSVPDAQEAGCTSAEKLCNGVCVSRSDPSYGCDALACAPCLVPQAQAGCSAGACVVLQCQAGWKDCDGLVGNGCEIDATTDVANCGACNAPCSVDNGVAACVASACAVASCTAPYGDCDGKASNGCEVDLMGYAQHCGACGHTCLGVGCSEGLCEPTTLSSVFTSNAYALALSADTVYFTRNSSTGGVYKVAKTGGAVTTLASAQAYPCDIAVDGTHVYWTNYGIQGSVQGAVMKTPIEGGTAPEVLVPDQLWANSLALRGSELYWGPDDMVGPLSRISVGGGPVTVIAPDQDRIGDIFVDAAALLWLTRTTVVALPHGSTTPSTIATGVQDTSHLVADATHVYFTDESAGSVLRVARTGGAVLTIATGQLDPHGLAIDDTHVYWVQNDGTDIQRAPKAGGPSQLVAKNQAGPQAVALDATHVYWTNRSNGTVRRVVK
jgi:sugar lactone lactonase YvrE